MPKMKVKMTKTNKKKFVRNLLVFFAPVALLYLSPLPAEIAEKGISWQVFIPSQFEWGAIVIYIINSTIDLIKKSISI